MAVRKDERLLARKIAELSATKEPRQRLKLAEEIKRLAVELEHGSVSDARRAGMTWTQIGALFGMTKQAAQQRFKNTGSKDSG